MRLIRPARLCIFTGDDFGSSEEVNQAIIQAHREGVLTSASLMVTGPAAVQAVEMARENPGLAVGLHLVLMDGRPALPPEEIPRLAADGRFPSRPAWAGFRWYFSPGARRQIQRELAAQFERFADTGLRMAHVDGHWHFHLHPAVFDPTLELAVRWRAVAVRVPWEQWTGGAAVTFPLLGRRARSRLRRAGLRWADGVYGLRKTGRVDEQYLLELLPRLGDGVNEIYCHPAPGNSELAALLSKRVRESLDREGIELASYLSLEGGIG